MFAAPSSTSTPTNKRPLLGYTFECTLCIAYPLTVEYSGNLLNDLPVIYADATGIHTLNQGNPITLDLTVNPTIKLFTLFNGQTTFVGTISISCNCNCFSGAGAIGNLLPCHTAFYFLASSDSIYILSDFDGHFLFALGQPTQAWGQLLQNISW